MHEIEPTRKKPLSAYLVGVRRPGDTAQEALEHLDELESLTQTYGVPVAGREVVTLRDINPIRVVVKTRMNPKPYSPLRVGLNR